MNKGYKYLSYRLKKSNETIEERKFHAHDIFQHLRQQEAQRGRFSQTLMTLGDPQTSLGIPQTPKSRDPHTFLLLLSPPHLKSGSTAPCFASAGSGPLVSDPVCTRSLQPSQAAPSKSMQRLTAAELSVCISTCRLEATVIMYSGSILTTLQLSAHRCNAPPAQRPDAVTRRRETGFNIDLRICQIISSQPLPRERS